MVNVGDFVFAEYDNGEIVNGEVVSVKDMHKFDKNTGQYSHRVLVTVKAEQGYRSIYLDKCVSFEYLEASRG